MPRKHHQNPRRELDSGPFSLDDQPAYDRWRVHKLRSHPSNVEEQRIPIARLNGLKATQRDQIVGACRRTNFALYRTDPEAPTTMEELRTFGERLGLVHFDHHLWAPEEGIVALRRESDGGRADYIPYTNRPMKWHTDGYYNSPDATVRGVIMHCVMSAAEGGANWLLDPDMAYIAMRDTNPAFIEALMRPDVMTIPENTREPGVHRPAISGPVFSVDPAGRALHMRFTARTRSIRWKDDAATRDAVAFLEELLTPPVAFAFRVCLKAGEGIVCNNVLHNREAFTDGPATKRQRLLWRARYRERIAGTSAWRDETL